METLIDDQLSLARQRQPVGELEDIGLADLGQSCWANIDTQEATLVSETDRTVRADRSRFQQLIENLIRNAIEHGGEEVTVIIDDLPNGVYVEDDGPGMPVEERDDIFDPGYSRSEEGTGFGLTIVEEVAEANGWEVQVTEASGDGARFEITGVEVIE